MNPKLFVLITYVILLVIAYIDLKTYRIKNGNIPSALTTSFLIVSFILGAFLFKEKVALSAIAGSLIALLFLDLNIYHGLPDIKVFIAASMSLPNLAHILILAFLTLGLSLIVKIIIKNAKFAKKVKEIPFIPIIFMAYTVFLI